MNNRIQKFLKKHKTLIQVHFISFGVLFLSTILCRYAFFGLHELKEWPYDLMRFGIIALLISLFSGKRYVPWVTSVGYFAWFWIGVIFNKETVDAHGTRGYTMPFIWLWGFLACILLCFLLEVIVGFVLKWWRLLKNPPQS